jgi:guanine nucleotide-binding protein subunit alpha
MGCGMSTEDKEGKARNEEIENQLKRDKMMQRNEIKMLLLGMICILNLRRAELTRGYRSRRVGQVHNPQADEAHP